MDNVMQRMRDLLTRIEAFDAEIKERLAEDPRSNVNHLVIARRDLRDRIGRMVEFL